MKDDVMRCFCLNLRRSARQVTQSYDAALKPSGLKATQFTLLAAVEKAGRSSLIPLATLLGMERTTLTRNLAVLERDGFIEMEQGDKDRREQLVRLTAKGAGAVAEAMPYWKQAQGALMRKMKTAKGMPTPEAVVGLVEDVGKLSRE